MNILDETLTIAESRDIKKAKAIQMELRDRVSLIDSFPSSPKKIFGVDLAYNGYTAFVSIVLWNNTSHEIEAVFNDFKKISFPYIPGFLSFREFPVFYMLYEKIQIKPDLVIFDGHGYAHPRRMGLATHAGILLNIPTIGCAKSRLVGTYKMPPNEVNSYTELKHKNELIGYVLRTRKDVKPIFVSPGNNISFESSLNIIKNFKRKTKLPYIMQMAHNTCENYKKNFLQNVGRSN